MTSQLQLKPLSAEELGDYGVERVKDVAFEAVLDLWTMREQEGLTQRALAERIGCNETFISRSFRGPANWTFRTLGRLARGLNGSVRIIIDPLEETLGGANYDAYDELDWALSKPIESKLAATATGNAKFSIIYNG